mmetsp:Transcript_26017/g.71370  ORF Transcript_26017/g.71370 Transcript_26017/m.71370 type:complete len:104 (+) Transcript_26017:184-495(+)
MSLNGIMTDNHPWHCILRSRKKISWMESQETTRYPLRQRKPRIIAMRDQKPSPPRTQDASRKKYDNVSGIEQDLEGRVQVDELPIENEKQCSELSGKCACQGC